MLTQTLFLWLGSQCNYILTLHCVCLIDKHTVYKQFACGIIPWEDTEQGLQNSCKFFFLKIK